MLCLGIQRDVHIDDHQLSRLLIETNQCIRDITVIHLACFHFMSLQDYPCIISLLDIIVEIGTFVFGKDTHAREVNKWSD